MLLNQPQPRSIQKLNWVLGLILLILGFRLLSGTPLPLVKELEAFAIVLMLGYVFVRFILYRIYIAKPNYTLFELYLLILQIVPLYSAWRAHSVFGQPFIYGVLTQRYVWVSCVALILLDLMKRGIVTIKHIERALLLLAWGSLLVYGILQIVVDPSKFAEEYPSFAAAAGNGEYTFKFETTALTFGFIYYLLGGILLRSMRHYWLALPFLLFLFVVIDKRSLYVAMGFVIIWVVWLYTSKARFIKFAFKSGLVIGMTLAILLVLEPEIIYAFVSRFSDALFVMATGEKGEDASSNARIIEVLMAMPYIESHPFLGSGDLSDQWENGFEGAMGYFFPSDIGLVGGVFVYGVVGVLVLYVQFFFLQRPMNKKVAGESEWLILVVLYAMAVLLLTQSFIKGGIVFTPAITLIFIVVARHGIKASRERSAVNGQAPLEIREG